MSQCTFFDRWIIYQTWMWYRYFPESIFFLDYNFWNQNNVHRLLLSYTDCYKCVFSRQFSANHILDIKLLISFKWKHIFHNDYFSKEYLWIGVLQKNKLNSYQARTCTLIQLCFHAWRLSHAFLIYSFELMKNGKNKLKNIFPVI